MAANLKSFFNKFNSKKGKLKERIEEFQDKLAKATEVDKSDEDFLPQEKATVKQIALINISKSVNPNRSYEACQGFISDGDYFYIAVLVVGKKGEDLNTRIIKIDAKTYKIVAEKDFGEIGHCNSLTYNPITKKIYAAPLYKKWQGIYEFDKELKNIRKIILKDKSGKNITNKDLWSVTYLAKNNQYIVKTGQFELLFFDSDFKLKKNMSIKQQMNLKNGYASQALTTDEKYLYCLCNDLNSKNERNFILVYSLYGKYLKKFSFTYDQDKILIPELEQVIFVNKKCYGVSQLNGKYAIYEINIKAQQ